VDRNKAGLGVLAPMTLLFFLWGFMTVLNDLLIPFLKKHYSLDYFESMLVQTSFFGSYFIGSLVYFIYSTRVEDPINKIGYKNGIIAGLILSGIGCMIFLPAGILDSYPVFLSGLMFLGFGFTLLQIAANPFVSIAGPPESSSARLNLAQAFNSLGTMLGPLVGGLIIFSYLSGLHAISYPYFVAGLIFFLVAVGFYFLPMPAWKNPRRFEKGFSALDFPNLKWGIGAIFCYVGAEVGLGSLIINILGLSEFGGLPESIASDYLSLYWGGLMLGRFGGAIFLGIGNFRRKIFKAVGIMSAAFLLIFISNLIKGGIETRHFLTYLILLALSMAGFLVGRGRSRRTLIVFSTCIIALILIAMFGMGELGMWSIIGIGLFNSIMWPNLFTTSIDGLGKYSSQGSSLLIMAILGGALIPPVMGWMADEYGLRFSLLVPILCYGYIILFASKLSGKSINIS
jgi:MFS transporter, FHS family, L-fucose permease